MVRYNAGAVGKESKVFFFEKKEPKNFCLLEFQAALRMRTGIDLYEGVPLSLSW